MKKRPNPAPLLWLFALGYPGWRASAQFPPFFELSGLDGRNGFAINGFREEERAGTSIASLPDIDADGYDDLIIGALGYLPDPYSPGIIGKAYVVFGAPGVRRSGAVELGLLNGKNGFVIDGLWPPDLFGQRVSFTGDVNKDGLSDFLVGAPVASPGGMLGAGQVWVFFGDEEIGRSGRMSPSSLNGTNGFSLTGIARYDDAGDSAAFVGDLNTDGYEDFAVGAAYANPGGRGNAGQVYVVFGGPTIAGPAVRSFASLDGTNGLIINGIAPADYSGWSVAGAGDVNADGVDDFVIGARLADPPGRTDAGQGYVVFGAEGIGASGVIELSSLDGSNGFTINGVAAGQRYGQYVAGVGDVNADGIDDLAVGPGVAQHAYVIFGRERLGEQGVIELSGLTGSDGFAVRLRYGLATHGVLAGRIDLNADGIADLVVANPPESVGGVPQVGETYVVYGRTGLGASGYLDATILDGREGFTLVGIDLGDEAGTRLSSAGDLNADGIEDLAVGAPRATPPGAPFRAGQTYIVFGRRLGDLDLDADVDVADFLVFQRCYSGKGNPPTPECPTDVVSDFDYDSDVDLADFLIFQQNFTGSR